MKAFATGTCLAVSVLDSIMSTAYYNHQALTLIKSLISGGMTPELEIILAEGAGLQPGFTCRKVMEKCSRCRLSQIAIASKNIFFIIKNQLDSFLRLSVFKIW